MFEGLKVKLFGIKVEDLEAVIMISNDAILKQALYRAHIKSKSRIRLDEIERIVYNFRAEQYNSQYDHEGGFIFGGLDSTVSDF